MRERGLRRGEAAGLRWCDVDLEHKAAYISWPPERANWAGVSPYCFANARMK